MDSHPVIVNLLCSVGKQKGVTKLLHDLLPENQHLVEPEDVERNASLAEKIVGAYIASSNIPSDPAVQDFLDKLPNLKILSFMGIGINRISLEWAKKKGLRIGHVGSNVSVDTADIAVIHMAVTARNFLQSLKAGMGKEDVELFPWHLQGHSLSGSTVGIIGMGNIGYQVAVRSYAFGMKIVYHQRNRRSEAEEKAVGAEFFPYLMDMLPQCDFVIITCPLTPQTHGLIGREQFKVMKKTATLVNVARGKIVDQEALYDVLKNKEIHAAALDVTDPEPLPRDHPLLSLPNIMITPHCGTNTFETRRAIIVEALENMECALQGKPMPSEVLLE